MPEYAGMGHIVHFEVEGTDIRIGIGIIDLRQSGSVYIGELQYNVIYYSGRFSLENGVYVSNNT